MTEENKKSFGSKWMDWSRTAAAFALKGILIIMYFTLFIPIGICFRLFADPIRVSKSYKDADTTWITRERTGDTFETSKNPF